MLVKFLIFLSATVFSFFLFQSLGFMLVTATVILLLTTSYAVKYWREGVGAGLAYFGLAYVGFGLALLGIGLLIRTGRCERVRQKGQWDFVAQAAGLHASTAKWLKARDVAVIGCDGVSDVMPSGVEGLANRLHELVLVGLGMPILDNLDLDPVADMAAKKGRYTFLFVGAPLRVPGGTGSPLNPIAIF